jgi:hypothetical protein
MYEPLTIGLVFSFLSARPWQLWGTPKMLLQLYLDLSMSGMFKDPNMAAGDLLRQLCQQMRSLSSKPEDVVQRVLYFGPWSDFHSKAKGRLRRRKLQVLTSLVVSSDPEFHFSGSEL